ncbi:MAG: tetratricopeptide repeat protein [bacterium]|nr:tetratricopeptide repeat protein [bacterium]
MLCLFIRRKNVYADVCGNAKAEEAYKEGMASFKEKLYNAARQQFEKAIRYDQNCVEAHYQLGLAYTFLIPYQDLAIVEFRKVQELVPDNTAATHVKAVFNEGLAHLRMGAYEEAIVVLKKVKELDPTYKELDKLHNYLGVAYCFLNNYEDGIREFKKAIQENATYREANYNLKSVNMRLLYFNVGVTYGFMGNYRQAIEQLNKAIEISTNFYNAHMELARIYIREGMYGDAISELIRCDRINPNHRNNRKVYMNLGIAYYNQGSPKIAVEYLRKALRLQPDYEEAIKNLRSIFQGYDPLKEEKTSFTEDPKKYIEVRMEVARDYYMVGLYDKAVAVCNEILNVDFQNKEAADLILTSYSARADYYIDKKDYSNAIKALKALLKITPENTDVWYKLGISYFSMPGNYWYKEAEEAFKKVISFKGKEEFIGESHYYIAQIYYTQKKNDEARTEVEIAIRNNTDNPDYHLLAAKINRTLGAFNDAEAEIKQAIELDAENEEYPKLLREIIKDKLKEERGLNKGGTEDQDLSEGGEVVVEDYKTLIRRGLSYVKREEFDNALGVFRSASEATPEGMEAHNNIGACLLRTGKFNEALVEFMVCESMSPKDAEIHINLAIAYYFLSDFKNAKEEYLKAIAINSEFSKDTLYIKLIESGTVPNKDFFPKIIWKNPK